MKTFGNILWLLLTGLYMGIIWAILGAVLCVTIIGIPFGLQCFKISKLFFWPFGQTVDKDFERHPIANFIWIVCCGLLLAIVFGALGIVWCITLIGIPFGKQCFKLAALAFMPFGAQIYDESEVYVLN